jgi:ABC-type Fe3+-hydroxamate transport system substrate-binding protein
MVGAGRKSYFSNFIKDAGAEYIFDDNDKSESVSLSIEQVFAAASAADFWLHPNNADSRKDILSVDNRMSKFEPFEKAKIYNNNKKKTDMAETIFGSRELFIPTLFLAILNRFSTQIQQALKICFITKKSTKFKP